MKKGQITGQVFIYIVSAVVIGFVLLFGIQAVLKILKTGCDVEMIQFKQDIQDRFEKGMQHGVVNDKPISVPSCSDFSEICFIQLKDGDTPTSPPTALLSKPLVYNSWEDHIEQNIFFIVEVPEEFMYVEGLEVEEDPSNSNFICELVVRGKINTLRFIGLGGGVRVERIT